MRFIIAFLLLVGATALSSDPSFAQRAGVSGNSAPVFPVCHRQPMTGSLNCGFTSFEQCMATASGDGGDCVQNPQLSQPRR